MELVFVGGSLRAGSWNRRLMEHLAGLAQGHEVRVFAGEDLRLPLFEEGLPVPGSILAMAEALRRAQGAFFVSPEYNAGIPAHLKNVVDWLSTRTPGPLEGLPVLLAAASPGAFGGSRGLLSWRQSLANLGAWVAPMAITVPYAGTSLAEDGRPLEERTIKSVERSLAGFLAMTLALQRGLGKTGP